MTSGPSVNSTLGCRESYEPSLARPDASRSIHLAVAMDCCLRVYWPSPTWCASTAWASSSTHSWSSWGRRRTARATSSSCPSSSSSGSDSTPASTRPSTARSSRGPRWGGAWSRRSTREVPTAARGIAHAHAKASDAKFLNLSTSFANLIYQFIRLEFFCFPKLSRLATSFNNLLAHNYLILYWPPQEYKTE